jgi:hypothetical protein
MVRVFQGLRRGDVDGLQCCQLFGPVSAPDGLGYRLWWIGCSTRVVALVVPVAIVGLLCGG